MPHSRILLLSLMVFGAAMSRLLPHPANFTPLLALCLFSGANFEKKWQAVLIPMLSMLASDLFLGFHDLMPVVYGCLVGGVYLGTTLRDGQVFSILGGTIFGSLVFFTVTNFFVWATSGMYSLDLSGLLACYAMALPFFQNSLLGDLVYSGFLFGGHIIISMKWRVLSEN